MREEQAATGLRPDARGIRLLVVGRGAWARRTVVDYSWLLGDFLESHLDDREGADHTVGVAKPDQALVRGLDGAAAAAHPEGAPGVLGTLVGALIGQLARRALGEYELPIPRPRAEEIVVMPENLTLFSQEWHIPAEVTRHAAVVADAVRRLVVQQPIVRDFLNSRLSAYVRAFGFDPGQFAAAVGKPEEDTDVDALMASMRTLAQERPAAELMAFGSTLTAHAEHVAASTAKASPQLLEALRRSAPRCPCATASSDSGSASTQARGRKCALVRRSTPSPTHAARQD